MMLAHNSDRVRDGISQAEGEGHVFVFPCYFSSEIVVNGMFSLSRGRGGYASSMNGMGCFPRPKRLPLEVK